MKDIMIDIETLGTRPYSVILSIGAVKFDPYTGLMGDTFYRRISVKSCDDAGLKTDIETVVWWLGNPHKVRAEALGGNDYLSHSLIDLMSFIGDDKNACIWANSPSFDLCLIRNACELIGIDVAWGYWQERDVRTVLAMEPDVRRNIPFVGNPHNALDDCRHQIKCLATVLYGLNN